MAKLGGPEPPAGMSSFDGEEATEVMDVPLVPPKAVVALPAEEPQDLEEKDKKYIAPRVIPAAAVPDKADGAKIVLNIPDARADRAPIGSAGAPPLKTRTADVVEGDKPAVAEVRARRRAPTVKMARPNLSALKATDDVDVALEDDFEPPPPLDAPSAPAKGLVQAVPIGRAPPIEAESRAAASLEIGRAIVERAPVSRRSGPHEAPATAIAIHETRTEKSRLPWVLFGALTLGAAAAGVFVATRKPDAELASKPPAPQASASVAVAGEQVRPAAVTATAEPTATVADVGAASAAPTVTAQATEVAVTPPPPPPTYQRPTTTTPAYTAPRPPATFPRPPPKKTSDIPSGI
jgi:hypothetical protein